MSQVSIAPPHFRNDINGLRAWAVVAVILYHFGVPGFVGGFVGVDVFFVVSGFLMTGIVVSGLERGEFSALKFYMARGIRILPALVVLCAMLLTLGWWMLVPLDYKMLGNHVVFSLTFLSNIKFWSEAGYFDAASHEKWLLHTWSLAVEWQFYLLLPLVLLAVWKWRPGRQSILIAMVVGLVASLALSIVATPLKPIAAFFLLPTRAWEMLAGGLVYLLAHRLAGTERQRSALEAFGVALLVASIVGFDSSSSWPGWRALVPVIGTVAVLVAAQPKSRWTGHSIAQWLGTRSYSLYLWHWPVVVAVSYGQWQDDPIVIAAGLALTLVLGDLSYRWVEWPTRAHLVRLKPRWGAAFLLGGSVAIATPGALVLLLDGVSSRLPTSVQEVANESRNKKPRQEECFTKSGIQSPSCVYGGKRVAAILIGDSHADAVTTALAAAVPNASDGIVDWSYISCPTVFGIKNLSPTYLADEKCGEFLEWSVKQLANIPKDVPLIIVNRASVYVLGHNEPGYDDANKPLVYLSQPYSFADPAFMVEFAEGLTDTACKLAKDRTVYLVRPIPEMGVDVPKMTVRGLMLGSLEAVSISMAEYHQRHGFVWAAQDAARDRCDVKILDPLPYLCRDGRCHGAKDGRPLYYDDDHLSEHGNKLLVPMFAEIFRARQ